MVKQLFMNISKIFTTNKNNDEHDIREIIGGIIPTSNKYFNVTKEGVLRPTNNVMRDYSNQLMYDYEKRGICELIIPPKIGGITIRSIADNAFSGSPLLQRVVLPPTITHLGYKSFSNCESLAYITMPSSVEVIGEACFIGCKSLRIIDIPDNLLVVPIDCFNGCSSLRNINMNNGLTYINDWSFLGCNSLTEIEIPPSVIYIGKNAFNNCRSINRMDIYSNHSLKYFPWGIRNEELITYCNLKEYINNEN